MKTIFHTLVAALMFCGLGLAQETITYTNYIRQFQMPSGVTWDASATVASSGIRLSDLAINPGGARFELWTIKSSSVSGLTGYPLDSTYVGTYVPAASVTIRTEDATGVVPRTRADRPFYVDVTVNGLLNGASDPDPSKSVKFLHHVQSYGVGGIGTGLDRTQATLLTQSFINTNGTQTLTYAISAIPGADRSKIRGEERFSVFSIADYQAPESQLASQYVQVCPVAEGSISGITQNQMVYFALPTLTLALNDLYPNSTTYAQVYKGNAVLGTTGKIVPGSALVISDSIPQSRVLTLNNYDNVFDSDGRYTIELLTVTPFGIDRLAYISFDLDRTIQVNGSVTTIE